MSDDVDAKIDALWRALDQFQDEVRQRLKHVECAEYLGFGPLPAEIHENLMAAAKIHHDRARELRGKDAGVA